jgi:hypothetical protein
MNVLHRFLTNNGRLRYHIVRRGFQWCRVECCHAIVVFLVPRVCVFLHHCGSYGRAMRRVFWNSTALLVVGATNGRGRQRSNWVRQVMVHQIKCPIW